MFILISHCIAEPTDKGCAISITVCLNVGLYDMYGHLTLFFFHPLPLFSMKMTLYGEEKTVDVWCLYSATSIFFCYMSITYYL